MQKMPKSSTSVAKYDKRHNSVFVLRISSKVKCKYHLQKNPSNRLE